MDTIKKEKVVLIVEDEVPLMLVLSDNLAFSGISTLHAVNGVQGLEMALKEHPDLILLDIVMPEMDGLAMLKKLREDEWGKTVPVIILTNLSDNDKIASAMIEDVFEYFVKSDIKIEEVIARVKDKLKI